MPDQSITVNVNVENLEQLKELRRELEKIKELKEDIQDLEQDEENTDLGIDDTDFPDIGEPIPDPNVPSPKREPYPEYPRRPRFWVNIGSSDEKEFDIDFGEEDKKTTVSTEYNI